MSFREAGSFSFLFFSFSFSLFNSTFPPYPPGDTKKEGPSNPRGYSTVAHGPEVLGSEGQGGWSLIAFGLSGFPVTRVGSRQNVIPTRTSGDSSHNPRRSGPAVRSGASVDAVIHRLSIPGPLIYVLKPLDC